MRERTRLRLANPSPSLTNEFLISSLTTTDVANFLVGVLNRTATTGGTLQDCINLMVINNGSRSNTAPQLPPKAHEPTSDLTVPLVQEEDRRVTTRPTTGILLRITPAVGAPTA